ncbi:acetaldehyde dehydrogenase (acetylating) [Micromonospora inositola]|uniref:Acetaldehyde dehydrogenase n=1 Tax=Micromonospora inositola TaxID=47865 RepID=A0A1C5K556_9ACTN|nr:acetaldehyde dehydrogenase (acetylating) [Micromonospora inositola]SCG77918.1 acetaldehyde dehydrogenase [Micromonospora inositola]
MASIKCAIVGSGNIGTDLMEKLLRSSALELVAMVGIDPASDGLARARARGLTTSHQGVSWLVEEGPQLGVSLVFDATSAAAHRASWPLLRGAGMRCVDLTPAKLGPGVVPVVNLSEHEDADNVNLITCGGQATVPMVAAVSSVTPVAYAETVSSIASLSAGPGTRQNIDEFTHVTSRALEDIGRATKGKAIIVLNPADPPVLMRNTVFCQVDRDADRDGVAAAVLGMVARVQEYVPGYRLRSDPLFDDGRVTILTEVEGAGDYLPPYAGNLDIMTAAAVRVGAELAASTAGREVMAP